MIRNYRIVASIGDDLAEPWQETFTAWIDGEPPDADAAAYVQAVVDRFNAKLRDGEAPRRLVAVTSLEPVRGDR